MANSWLHPYNAFYSGRNVEISLYIEMSDIKQSAHMIGGGNVIDNNLDDILSALIFSSDVNKFINIPLASKITFLVWS